ncbi:MAG: phenylalanine--tRNA ligase subunit beta [archaeon]|nr:phenylalanine--tRNA ligase subunit beta [archaeon]
MPTIECNVNDLNKLLGKDYSIEELRELVNFAIAEIDAVEGDTLKIDVKTSNRPDLWSVEGIARAIVGRIGTQKGIPKIEIKKGNNQIIVEESIAKVRPFIAAAIAKNVEISEEFLIQLIQLQEKVDGSFGRKREHESIGIYDFDKIVFPITYKAVKPESITFLPLNYETQLNLEQILERHPKGKEYAHLLKQFNEYPILIDGKKQVLSFPPIINSQHSGKVTTQTKNLFIEVTGLNQNMVLTALNVLTQALSDRGASIESIKCVYGKKTIETPDFSPKKIELTLEEVNDLSGLNLTQKQAIDLLEKSRYEAKTDGKKIVAHYPAYRQDILHSVDAIEDIIVSYGYNEVEPEILKAFTIGKERNEAKELEIARDVCIGLELQEVLTFALTSKETQEKKLNLKEEEFVELANPMNASLNVFRKRLTPELLNFLASNQHASFPQKIFELGNCLSIDLSKETKVAEKNTLCIMLSHTKTDFTEIKSHLEAFASNYGIQFELKELNNEFLINGRSAEISTQFGKGFIGELSPEVLNNFGIKSKATVLELPIM